MVGAADVVLAGAEEETAVDVMNEIMDDSIEVVTEGVSDVVGRSTLVEGNVGVALGSALEVGREDSDEGGDVRDGDSTGLEGSEDVNVGLDCDKVSGAASELEGALAECVSLDLGDAGSSGVDGGVRSGAVDMSADGRVVVRTEGKGNLSVGWSMVDTGLF